MALLVASTVMLLGGPAATQESAEEADPMAETNWTFYEVDFSFAGSPLIARRFPFYGVEVPNVRYQNGEEPIRPPRTIALSPFPPGQPEVSLGLLPAREGAAGTLVITVRLTRARDALRRWVENMSELRRRPLDLATIERDGAFGLVRDPPARPVELVVLVGADDPDLYVSTRAYFDDRGARRRGEPPPPAGWAPPPAGVALQTLDLGEATRFEVEFAAGQPAQQVALYGDDLRVVIVF